MPDTHWLFTFLMAALGSIIDLRRRSTLRMFSVANESDTRFILL